MPTILFNKPYGVLSQFTPADGHKSLACFGLPKKIYPAGRLDADSEGLLLLTSEGKLQAYISEPKHKQPKTYWAQVERIITEEALEKLRNGIILKDGPTKPCQARLMEEPGLPPRNPPIRERKTVPTSWVEIILTEGRNRQARRMLASVGFPVLRLIRHSIGIFTLDGIQEGKWREATQEEIRELWKQRKK
ncbi:MAG: pseudouridine synthase [Elusimicrobiales bacterium]|nr:pseudouridine synthase [Elusimicrobiales bacterium]